WTSYTRCSSLSQWRRNPRQCEPNEKAEAKQRIRECPYEARNSVSEESNSGEPKGQEQNREAVLHQHVPCAASQQHGNVHDPVFHYGISERQGIQGQHQNQRCVEPKRRTISCEVHRYALENDRQDAGNCSPQNHSRFATRLRRDCSYA